MLQPAKARQYSPPHDVIVNLHGNTVLRMADFGYWKTMMVVGVVAPVLHAFRESLTCSAAQPSLPNRQSVEALFPSEAQLVHSCWMHL